MASQPRKTYDTDVITLRRVFGYNPDTNAPIPCGTILAVTGCRGSASFIDPMQLSSLRGISTVVDAGTFEALSTGSLGVSSIEFIDTATQTLQTLVVSSGILYLNTSTIMGTGNVVTDNLVSTFAGLGTGGYISTLSTNQLSTGVLKSGDVNTSTVNFIDAANGNLRTLTASNDYLYFNDQIVNYANIYFNTSSYIYQVSSVSSLYAFTVPVIVSSATNLYINTDYYSSVSFSTAQLGTSSLIFVDQATQAEQIVGISTGLFLLNGAPIVADLTKEQMFSTAAGLGTMGYISSAQLGSTTVGFQSNLLPPYLASTVAGLGKAGYTSNTQLTSTTGGLVTNLFPPFFTSTVRGLGAAGYISSPQLLSSSAGLILPGQLGSTVVGLGTVGYLSSQQLISTTSGLLSVSLPPLFVSTVVGLGTARYISSAQLTSTTSGILGVNVPALLYQQTSNLVSTPSLLSSFSNLYVPYSAAYTASNFQIMAKNNNLFFGFSNNTNPQIFVGDARRFNDPTNTDPLIFIDQDAAAVPRGADVINLLGGSANNRLLKVDSNLNLGVGLDTATYFNATGLSYTLQVEGSVFASSIQVRNRLVASNYMVTSTMILADSLEQFSSFGDAGTNIRLALASGDAYKPTGATWNTLSDFRIKENIVDADVGRCYNDVKKIQLHRYRYTSSFVEQAGVLDRSVLGFIAQEVSAVMPKSVTQQALYGFDDLNTISVDQINMAAFGALKKTIADKEALESTARGLMTLNTQLTQQLANMTRQLSGLQTDFATRFSTLEGRMEEMKNDLSMSHSIL